MIHGKFLHTRKYNVLIKRDSIFFYQKRIESTMVKLGKEIGIIFHELEYGNTKRIGFKNQKIEVRKNLRFLYLIFSAMAKNLGIFLRR